ncbi:hypothetical protein C7445_10522 [Alicyclobacillus sacchari]|uniref:Uncharacterized protein n=1 Tax=Alicyclobacillus sacchari TaxID=392010 RepID=A0A4R8LNL2_9BACL|nr:hypothetical protein C7445_10522 [Alicyclobacillus sacchari]
MNYTRTRDSTYDSLVDPAIDIKIGRASSTAFARWE